MWKLVLHHGDQFTEIFLLSGHEYTIGRTPSSEIYINHPTISRAHATISIRDDVVVIRDLGSKNGTFVNEEPVRDRVEIRESVSIRLGSVPLFLEKVPPRTGDTPIPDPYSTYDIDPSLQFFLRSETLHEFQRLWSYLNELSQEIKTLIDQHVDSKALFYHAMEKVQSVIPIKSYALIDTSNFPEEPPEILVSKNIKNDDPRLRWAAETASNLIRPTWALLTRDRAAVVIPIMHHLILYLNIPPEQIIQSEQRALFTLSMFIVIQAWLEPSIARMRASSRWDAWIPFAFWGYSPRVFNLIQKIREIAPTSRNLYLYGPPGSGKKTLAHYIHQISNRKGELALININDPSSLIYSLPTTKPSEKNIERLWWNLHQGTAVLYPVDQLPAELQPPFLEWLKNPYLYDPNHDSQVTLHIQWILIGHHSPDELLKLGLIQPELWNTLNPIVIEVPPLLDRKEDIPVLANHLLQQTSRGQIRGFVPDALHLLSLHSWPQNLTELKNVIEKTVERLLHQSPIPPLLVRAEDLLPFMPQNVRDEWHSWVERHGQKDINQGKP